MFPPMFPLIPLIRVRNRANLEQEQGGKGIKTTTAEPSQTEARKLDEALSVN